MASFDYTNSRATADRLVERFGRSITIIRQVRSGSSYEPTVTETGYSAIAAVVDYTNREIDGQRILVGDRRVLLKAGSLEIEPTNTDRISFDGILHSIVSVKPVNPGGTVVLYDIQIRRG